MQSKGLIKWFTILMLVVSIFILTFTWAVRNVEKKANAYGNEQAAAKPESERLETQRLYKQNYLDSISDKSIYLGFTYEQCKKRQLAYGLDLQGGMSVVLQVSMENLIKNLAGTNAQNPAFKKALETAVANQTKSNKDLVTLFSEAYKSQNSGVSLSALFATKENAGKIQTNSTEDEVLQFIRDASNESFESASSIINNRVDKFGVTSANISADNSTNRIALELPGVENPRSVRKLLQATAQLEFWETYENNNDIINMLSTANNTLKTIVKSTDTTKIATDTNSTAGTAAELLSDDNTTFSDSIIESSQISNTDTNKNELLNDSDTSDAAVDSTKIREEFQNNNPLFAILQLSLREGNKINAGPIIGYANAKDTALIMSYLKMERIKTSFPKNIKFAWSDKDIENAQNIYSLYALKPRISDMKAAITTAVIANAKQDFDEKGQPNVDMEMNDEGAKQWKKLTGDNIGKYIAIVIDDHVISSPIVNSELGKFSQISGGFQIDEAKQLAAVLKAGKLPAQVSIVEEDIVGPSLGKNNINKGLMSLLVGFLLIVILMVLYYNNSGWILNIVLIINLILIVGMLASLNTTLTLAGMAGILLTIAIAVDANILIYERIKEELEAGKSLRVAVDLGYKHALSSILDANFTNLITGCVMLYFGLGPVKGFAVVLVIGILSALFTAILVSRWFIESRIEAGKEIKFWTNWSRKMFKGFNIDFVGMRKIGYFVSGSVIVIGIASMFLKGFDYGVDFSGGRTYTVKFDKDVNTTNIRNVLTPVFGEMAPAVKTYGSDNQVRITTNYMIDKSGTDIDSLVETALFNGLKPIIGEGVDYNQFVNNYKMSSQKVGPTIADDIKNTSWIAALVSIVLIFIYIYLRFRKWQYSAGAILATVHDVMFVLAVFSLMHALFPFTMEVDQTFIAAILTIIGYSLNDTVVVFDRIREYLKERKNQSFKDTINSAINDTLSRTLLTSLITFIVVFVLFVFGGEAIRGFSFAMLLGVIVGTYSSIFIATPVVVDLMKNEEIKQVK